MVKSNLYADLLISVIGQAGLLASIEKKEDDYISEKPVTYL